MPWWLTVLGCSAGVALLPTSCSWFAWFPCFGGLAMRQRGRCLVGKEQHVVMKPDDGGHSQHGISAYYAMHIQGVSVGV